jgi:recombination protein RecT
MSDLVRRTQETQAKTLQQTERIEEFVRSDQRALELALAGRIGPDRFIAAAVTTFRGSPKLAQTSPESRLGALYIAAQLGLEVGGPRGLAYVVPYGKEATFVMGYKGFVHLFYAAGAKAVDWFLVREGDHFRMGSSAERGLVYEWAPAQGVPDEKRPWTGAVAQVHTANGGIVWEFMTKAQILLRRPKPIPDAWRKWEEQQALKTVLRQVAKRVPLSTELALAHDADETIQRRIPGSENAVLHLPVEGGGMTPVGGAIGEHVISGRSSSSPRDEEEEPPPPPPEEDDEARFERESTAEFNRMQDEAGPV